MLVIIGQLRTPRLKILPEKGPAWYHCMSRTVNGEWLFQDADKEILRQHIWQVAEYCGVAIVSYAIMSSHFHVLARVPVKGALTDQELLRRYRLLHSRPTLWETMRLEAIERLLNENGERAQRWRERQLAMMGDISPFMQLLKQRFSIWFNRAHKRFGTLWAERYKSVLVEGTGPGLTSFAAYVDLNSVRAGLVDDPKDYRFCGYAEAVAGNPAARAGIESITGIVRWEDSHSAYRQVLFGIAAEPRDHAAAVSTEAARAVAAAGGKLSLAEILRCRVRYLTDGAVLGSKAFVAEQIASYRNRTGRGAKTVPRPLTGPPEWDGLSILRKLHLPVIS